MWNWHKVHGDRVLHESDEELKALRQWFASDPHLDESEELVNQASLLGICLGVGILLKDARCALFTKEDEYPEGTPVFITDSIWTVPVYDMLGAYIRKLQRRLQGTGGAAGYVNRVDLLQGLF